MAKTEKIRPSVLDEDTFDFCGPINYAAKLTIIKEVLNLDPVKTSKLNFKKKVRYLIDECLTNILNYYSLNSWSNKKCLFKFITTAEGNLVLEFESSLLLKDVKRLKDNLKGVSAMSSRDKKTQFGKTLKKELDENARGAGLGILTIKQKAGQDLSYFFKKISKTIYRFRLKITVKPD